MLKHYQFVEILKFFYNFFQKKPFLVILDIVSEMPSTNIEAFLTKFAFSFLLILKSNR